VSDTPRTEAEVNRQKCWSDDIITIDANFACQLERELNAANHVAKKYEDRYFTMSELRNNASIIAESYKQQLEAANERIKRLEEEVADLKGINAAMAMDAAMYEYRGERIKRLDGHIERLESIGDSLFDGVTRIEAEQRWRKAKEAKP
jgi:archaellum component FlaC